MYTLLSLTLIAIAAGVSAAGSCPTGLSCLSSNAAASSYCTTILEAFSYLDPPHVSTKTATVTASAESGQVTVTSKTIATIYITEGATSTIYTTSVVSTTAQAVVTTYVSSAGNAKRVDCDTSAGLSTLSGLNSDALSTACSCIDAVPTPSTITTEQVVSITVTLAAQATVTSILSGEVKFTVAPSSVISTTVTSSFTQTSSVTLAAPTFIQVFGPTAGCANLNPIESEALDPGVTSSDAASICQGHCAQNPRCSFVYVQLAFENWSPGIAPFFQCSYNDHLFNEAEDIECGKSVNIWGLAKGFDAIGRGV